MWHGVTVVHGGSRYWGGANWDLAAGLRISIAVLIHMTLLCFFVGLWLLS